VQLGAAVHWADFTIAEQAADGQLWEVLAAEARIHVGFAIEPLSSPEAGKQQRCNRWLLAALLRGGQ
jgi:hypothetical protein